MLREGFWKSNREPHLPMPVENAEPFVGKSAFLGCLARVESKAEVLSFRGFSTCRLCGCANGSREYRTSGAAWPEGLWHYIEAHNVMPSQEFMAHIAAMTASQ